MLTSSRFTNASLAKYRRVLGNAGTRDVCVPGRALRVCTEGGVFTCPDGPLMPCVHLPSIGASSSKAVGPCSTGLTGWLLAEVSAQDFVSKRDLRSRDSGWRVPCGAGGFVHTLGSRVLTRGGLADVRGCRPHLGGVLVPPCFLSIVL